MPFDGAPSHERMPVQAPKIKPRSEASVDPYAFARQSMDAFLDEAQQNSDLSDDQKALLAGMREDPRLQKFDEVVYVAPDGEQYRFRDYFVGHPAAERALKEAGIVLQRFKDVFDAENTKEALAARSREQVERMWMNAQEARAGRALLERPLGPTVAPSRGWEERMRMEWEAHAKATEEHLAAIRASLAQPLAGAEAFARIGQPAPFTPVGRLPPLPGQPGYEMVMSWRPPAPSSEKERPALEGAVTTVMPAPMVTGSVPVKPKPGGFLRRIFG